jgi:DinB superfamily
MDDMLNERNAASRARIRAIAGHLSDEELSRPIDGAWTAGAVFAHVAFWDRFVLGRWRLSRESDGGVPPGLGDTIHDLVNDAALPQWVLVPPREAVQECLSASEELDTFIGSLDEDSISEVVVAGPIRLVDRSLHRDEHLDAVEARLSGGSS